MANKKPRVFISYSYDSESHKGRVKDFSDRLESEGCDCRIDVNILDYDDGDLPIKRWMPAQVKQADFILCVITQTYKKRFDGEETPPKGNGVVWEADDIRNRLYRNGGCSKSIIPIYFNSDEQTYIPEKLDFPSYHTGSHEQYQALVTRLLANQDDEEIIEPITQDENNKEQSNETAWLTYWNHFHPLILQKLEANNQRLYRAFSVYYPDYSLSELMEVLRDESIENVVSCLSKILKQMKTEGAIEGLKGVENLAQIWMVLNAAEEGYTVNIKEYLADPYANPIPMTAFKPENLDIESKMALAEQREARLRLEGHRLYSPHDFTPCNQTGEDPRDQRAARDAQESIQRKYVPGMTAFSERLESKLVDFTTDPENEYGISKEEFESYDFEEQGKLVGTALELESDDLSGKLYIRVAPQILGTENSRLNELHQWCSNLVVVEVTTEKDVPKTQLYMRLHKLICNAKQYCQNKN